MIKIKLKINKNMTVLGFSVGHDKGAVIIKNGQVIVGITQERLTRRKHDGAFTGGAIPVESIMYCLSVLDITVDDLDELLKVVHILKNHMKVSMRVKIGLKVFLWIILPEVVIVKFIRNG